MAKRTDLRATAGLAVTGLILAASGIYFAGRSGTDSKVYSNDFNVYYYAAHEVMAGRDPYQNSLGDGTRYLYPPLLAQMLIPLAALPLNVAAFIWFLISAGSLLGAAWLAARLATGPDHAGSHWHPGLIAVLAMLVVVRFALDTFDLGQVNTIVALLVSAHLFLSWRGRRFASALALALAVSIKLTPLLFILYQLVRRRWRLAAESVVLIVVLITISFGVFGSGALPAFETFFQRTVANEQGFDFGYHGNQSLRGATARIEEGLSADENRSDLENRRPSSPLTTVIGLTLLLLTCVSASRARDELAAAAPFVCLMVVLSPLSWKAHFVVLLIPAAWLHWRALRVRAEQQSSDSPDGTIKGFGLAAASLMVFALFNLTSPNIIGLKAAEWADAHSLVLVGALLLFASTTLPGLLERPDH